MSSDIKTIGKPYLLLKRFNYYVLLNHLKENKRIIKSRNDNPKSHKTCNQLIYT